MIPELLQERAAVYACGAMSAAEREEFELVLEFHDELRALVTGFHEAGVKTFLATLPPIGAMPSAQLKTRIMEQLGDRRQHLTAEGLVVSDPSGLVQWVSPAFTEMCGYTLGELRGKKLGPILQGERTDRAVAERMREAVHQHRPCREKILNYHRNGTPYWVDIAITPILDDANEPLWLIARERELAEAPAA